MNFTVIKTYFIIGLSLCAFNAHGAAAEKQAKAVDAQHEYTINLMWINQELNRDQYYIHPAVSEDDKKEGKRTSSDRGDLYKNFLTYALAWAKLNQGGIVNLWFDSATTTKEAVQNTEQVIEIITKDPAVARIVLRDVRKLPEVVKHPEAFSAQIPIFFRADLLRAIAAYNDLVSGETKCFVYTDLDVEPLSRAQLFDDETCANLKKFATVMAAYGNGGYENGFQVIGNHNANLLKAMKLFIIDYNIACFYQRRGWLTNSNCVWSSYPHMFEYFYHLENYGTLMVQISKGDDIVAHEKYNENKHGLTPCLNPHHRDGFYERLEFEVKDVTIRGRVGNGISVPTKKVDYPPSQHSTCVIQ